MADSILYYLVKAFAGLVRLLPAAPSLWAARRIGDLVYLLKPGRSRIAYLNIKCSYEGRLKPRRIKKIVRGVYRSLMQNFFELLRFPVLDKGYLERNVECNGFAYADRALEGGRGAIFLTAHFGNWELASIVVPLLGYKLKVLAREQTMPRLDALLNSYRASRGAEMVFKGIKTKALFKALKANETVGILVDQDGGRQGYFVDFFGRLTSTHPGAISLSLRTGCKVLPGFIRRLPRGRHAVTVEPPLDISPSQDEKKVIRDALQAYASILERFIRRNPQQWLWLHKRWKSTPSRKVVILSDGRPGHDNQSKAVAAIIGNVIKDKYADVNADLERAVSVNKIEVEFKGALSKALFGLARYILLGSPPLLKFSMKLLLKRDIYRRLMDAYADIVISCGASLGSINRVIARENDAKSIGIMRLPAFDMRHIDMCIVPRHDGVRELENVVIIDGAITDNIEGVKKEAARLKDELGLGDGPKLGLLLGGDSRRHILDKDTVGEVLDGIEEAAEALEAEILITTSRRTPRAVEDVVEKKMAQNKRLRLLVIANRNNRPGVVSAILGLAEVTAVSGESASMVTEAVSSGNKIVAFALAERKTLLGKLFAHKAKHNLMLDEFSRRGYLKIAEPHEVGSSIIDAARGPSQASRPENREALRRHLEGFNI